MISANKPFSQSEYELYFTYNELLNSIEEGFTYLIQSFEVIEYTEGERVMNDIIDAFVQIDSIHSGMYDAANEGEPLQQQILLFDRIIDELMPFTTSKDDSIILQSYIKDKLFTLFLDWKKEIQAYIMPYILH
ncbi:hypothetical protein [Metabacillus idriensis]|uniref:hypothetical protein n=1 Tax=Metabacillus idriensis TaxID=324768 RepID=UPI00174CF136|nr:hypothetical protein [Metabacillus idriensis]